MRVAFALAACFLLAACASSQRPRPSANEMDRQAMDAGQQYVIGAADVLQITVWRNPEISTPEVVVRPDGKISFPLIDDVQAAGRTPLELKKELTEKLTEYIVDPTLTVVVRSIGSKYVFVIGEVSRVGPIPIANSMRVVDALSVMGGFSPYADKRRVKVIRSSEDGTPMEFEFDYEAFVDGTDPSQNILLSPGDKIVVPEKSLVP